MLSYIPSSVITKNQSEKKINSLLEFISDSDNHEIVQKFYEKTLEALKKNNNDRLWFKTNMKLCSLYFKKKEFHNVSKIVEILKTY